MALSPTGSRAGGLPLGLTGATAATRYAGATASGAPGSGTFALGDFIIDQTGKVFVCTVAGSPGTWVQAGGSALAWTVFAPVAVGWTASPTVKAAYIQSGKMCWVRFQVQGTSNATTATLALPFTAGTWTTAGDFYSFCQARDNTVNLTTPGMVEIVSAATVATIYKDGSFATWTASGTKQVYGEYFYETV